MIGLRCPTQNGVQNINLVLVTPAHGGGQGQPQSLAALGSRLRGNDDKKR